MPDADMSSDERKHATHDASDADWDGPNSGASASHYNNFSSDAGSVSYEDDGADESLDIMELMRPVDEQMRRTRAALDELAKERAKSWFHSST
jgi:hypothetical protein